MEYEKDLLTEQEIRTVIRRHLKKHSDHKGYPLRGVIAQAQVAKVLRLQQTDKREAVRALVKNTHLRGLNREGWENGANTITDEIFSLLHERKE